MLDQFHPAMLGIGVLAGFMSGLFGIGGGIIVTPLLVVLYPGISGHRLPIDVVTGLSAAQGFFSSALSYLLHRAKHRVDWHILKWFAIPMALANFGASLSATYVSERHILFIFGLLGLMSLFMTFCIKTPIQQLLKHPRVYLPAIGAGLGVLCGLIGQGGGFIYLPVLISLFGLPVKQAVSTSAAIGMISAAGALFGRANGDLSFLDYTIELIAGILIGGFGGAAVSHRLSSVNLKQIMNVFIFLCSLQLILKAFL